MNRIGKLFVLITIIEMSSFIPLLFTHLYLLICTAIFFSFPRGFLAHSEQPKLVLDILDISISYGHIASYNKVTGCPADSDTAPEDFVAATDQFNILIEVSIVNNGNVDFHPSSHFVGRAECTSLVIYKFYDLVFNGDYLTKYGSCVVDDSNYIDKSSCPTIISTSGSAALGILAQQFSSNAGYGIKRSIVVKFPISNAQYVKLVTNSETPFQVTLSLNKEIVENTPVTLDITVGDKLNGLASSSNWITGTHTYHPSVRLYDGKIFARYSASSFVGGSSSWADISGNHRDATVTGAVSTGTDEFGFPIITGDTTTAIEFPVGEIGSVYTIFYRAKYNGPNKQRILTSNSYAYHCNWVSGFYGGYISRAYHGYGWIADSQQISDNQWLISTDQLHLSRGNGVDYTYYPNTLSACVFMTLGINLIPGETSDWAVSDVIIYSRELSLSEIQTVEASLHVGLTVPPSFQPSARPTSSDRLLAKYSASTAITGGQWPDISGNENHATVLSGAVSTGTDESGKSFLTGDTTTAIQFPIDGIGSVYTIFYRAKYNGPNKQRILTSSFDGTSTCNWVSGFHDGYISRAYHGFGWITDSQLISGDQWLISTDQLHLYRGNGVDYTYYPNTFMACIFTTLGINLIPGETSDWAVSDVIIYSRELSLSEIQTVEASLQA